MSQWAERYRKLGDESTESGLWKNWRSPFLVGPMNAFCDPDVRVIVYVFANQIGKTECINNCIGYAICEEPGTTLLCFPSEHTSDKHIRSRLHPMVKQSPELRQHLVGNSDDLGQKAMYFDSCMLFTAWSNSPDAMSSTPCRYVFGDELDSFSSYAGGRHGNPIEQLAVRVRRSQDLSKQVYSGTPTTELAYLWPLWETTNQQHYWVHCPHCGRYQVMEWELVKYPKGKTANEIYEGRLAHYQCRHKSCEIRDEHKMGMLQAGRWVPKGCQIDAANRLVGDVPPKIKSGFHLNVLYSPTVTFGQVAAKWLESLGDPGDMHNFRNLYLALPNKQQVEVVGEKKILAAKRPYRQGVVQPWMRKLTCGIDVQLGHFWYTARGWGLREKSGLVASGRLESWQDVIRLLRHSWPGADGGQSRGLDLVLIDSGYEAQKVYEFAFANRPLVRATKGSNNPSLVQSLRRSMPKPGRMLWTFKADYYKDKLASLINSKPDLNADGTEAEWWGEWCVYEEIEDEYVAHMVAENRVWVRKNGRKYCTWETRSETTPNHLWDSEVLNVVAADLLQVRFLSDENFEEQEGNQGEERGPRADWLSSENNWLEGEGGDKWLDG